MILFHVGAEFFQVRKGILPPGEIFEIVHIVDIETDAVQRNSALPVFSGHSADF